MNIKLSVLICTLPSRVVRFLPVLIQELDRQCTSEVECLYLGDNKRRSVGEKRNDLLRLAKGEYVVFVDDDDWVTPDYVKELIEGCHTGADVVVFKVMCKIERKQGKEVIYNANFKKDMNKARHYERLPNHIMCIKKELALKVGFKQMNFGEDVDFATKLRPLIGSQCVIEKVLYNYNFSHRISETQ